MATGSDESTVERVNRRKTAPMIKLGYKLMSEEHSPTNLVRNIRRAEQAGFEFAAISDHFSPWIEEQRGGWPTWNSVSPSIGGSPADWFRVCRCRLLRKKGIAQTEQRPTTAAKFMLPLAAARG